MERHTEAEQRRAKIAEEENVKLAIARDKPGKGVRALHELLSLGTKHALLLSSTIARTISAPCGA